MLSRFLRGSSVIFAGLLVGKALTLLNSIVMARYLHAEYYGLFLLALTILDFARIPSNLGTPSILPKLISEYNEQQERHKVGRVVSSALGSSIALTVLLATLMILSAPFLSEHIFESPGLKDVLRALALVLPASVAVEILLAVYRGYQMTGASFVFRDTLPPTLRLSLFLIFFSIGYKIEAAYYAYFTAFMLILFIMVVQLKRMLGDGLTIKIYDSEISRGMFSLAWPLMIQSSFWIIYSQIDRIFIGYFMQTRDVGIFGAASSVAAIVQMVPQSFSYLALPMFSKLLASNSLSEFKLLYKDITTLMFFLSLPVFICLLLLAREILSGLYGQEYSSGAIALAILSGGILSRSLVGPADDSLVSAGKTKAPLISIISGCIVNVVLNILLIPMYGINGAAIATCAGMLATRFVIGYFNHRYLKIVPMKFNFSFGLWIATCLCLTPLIICLKNIWKGYPTFNLFLSGTAYLGIAYGILVLLSVLTGNGKKRLLEE